MKLEPSEAKTGLDRMATNEEIRAAFSLVPSCVIEVDKGSFVEIQSDRGGYEHIEMLDEVIDLLAQADVLLH